MCLGARGFWKTCVGRARLMKKKVSSADAAAYNLYIYILYSFGVFCVRGDHCDANMLSRGAFVQENFANHATRAAAYR